MTNNPNTQPPNNLPNILDASGTAIDNDTQVADGLNPIVPDDEINQIKKDAEAIALNNHLLEVGLDSQQKGGTIIDRYRKRQDGLDRTDAVVRSAGEEAVIAHKDALASIKKREVMGEQLPHDLAEDLAWSLHEYMDISAARESKTVHISKKYRESSLDEARSRYNSLRLEAKKIILDNMLASGNYSPAELVLISRLDDGNEIRAQQVLGIDASLKQSAPRGILKRQQESVINKWSQWGTIKKTLAMAGVGVPLGAMIGGAMAGLGAAGAVGAVFSTRVSKRMLRQHLDDAAGANSYTEKRHKNSSELQELQLDKKYETLAQDEKPLEPSMLLEDDITNMFASNVESKVKANRRQMAVIIGTTALFGFLGESVGDWIDDRLSFNNTPISEQSALDGDTAESAVLTDEGLVVHDAAVGEGYIQLGDIGADEATLQSADETSLPVEQTQEPNSDGSLEVPPSENTPIVPPTLNVQPGEGFEDVFQREFNLTDSQAAKLINDSELRNALSQEGQTYVEDGDLRILNPGKFELSHDQQQVMQAVLEEINQ